MVRTVPAAFQTALNTRTTTTCLCWLVERQDGVTLGFTDHDTPLTFGGVTYEASTSFVGSAIESQLGLAVSNLEAMGAISSDSVTEADLEAGRYDEANLTISLVNWLIPTQNVVLIKGPLGQVQIGDLAYQAEIRSLSQHFQQFIGSLCSQKCRSDMFDPGQGLDGGCNFPEPPPVPATVLAVTDRSHFQVSASGSFPDGHKGSLSRGYFAFGTATFTSGENSGVSIEIDNSDPTLNITLIDPLPADLEVGDELSLQFGCDKTLPVCSINFNNAKNMRAEPFVPGKDFIFKVNGEV